MTYQYKREPLTPDEANRPASACEFVPIFAGTAMSYNGNATGYRQSLRERLAALANGEEESVI